MIEPVKDLGRLTAVHPIAPSVIQRAVFVAALSFVFFLAMMFMFYLRQSLLYFLLATAFLLVYLATMASFITLRRKTIELREHGIAFQKARYTFDELASISGEGQITLKDKRVIDIPISVAERESLISNIQNRIGSV